MESNSHGKKHFLVVLGARPNFVKAGAFFQGAKKFQDIDFTIIHTGQHFDDNMSKIFFDEMRVPQPDIHLDIQGEYHTEKIGKMFSGLKKIFQRVKSDGVIVFGDINSTLAGAIAASNVGIPLIHIEAGLRSHDRRMPEEINRVIVDHMSDILFTTEPSARSNLLKEGIPNKKIYDVGNIMIESIERFGALIKRATILDDLNLSKKSYVVATIHRSENTDDQVILGKILDLLKKITKSYKVIMPLHPGTRKKVEKYAYQDKMNGIYIIDPLGYFEFMKLIQESVGVITDSGGIQEETSHLGIPCATLRDNTERPITLTLGSNKLFPIETMSGKDILNHLSRVDFNSKHIPLWDKEVSARILNILQKWGA